MGFYEREELEKLGFKSLGRNVLISKKASLYGIANMEIGNNVRIDDFCILSGNITLSNYIHIGAGSYLFAGDAGIEFKDYSGISSKVLIYAKSDDYSGHYMTNPMIPEQYINVKSGKVCLEEYVIVGAGSIILPSVTIKEGTAIGANSLVTKSTEEWSVYFGSPCKKIKNRSKDLLKLENKLQVTESFNYYNY